MCKYISKKQVRVLWIMVFVVFFSMFGSMENIQAAETKEMYVPGDGVVIYLDPGHDKRHSGCEHFGEREDDLNLKVALYCKAELEKYEGVTVYLCRDKETCPAKTRSFVDDNLWRVSDAVSKHADIYVALHFNSENAKANGCTVIVPNKNGDRMIYKQGQKVGEKVLNQLTALGIKDLGLMIRNSEKGSRYSDGKKADYYTVVKYAKLNGMVGIIVEHAFLSNRHDYKKFCSSETKLKRLGKADATGLAQYFKLKKKQADRVSMIGVVQTEKKKVNISWDAYADADLYRIYRRESAEEPWECIAEVEEAGFEDMHICSDTRYYYSVKARNKNTGEYTVRSHVFSIQTAQ